MEKTKEIGGIILVIAWIALVIYVTNQYEWSFEGTYFSFPGHGFIQLLFTVSLWKTYLIGGAFALLFVIGLGAILMDPVVRKARIIFRRFK